MIDVLRHVRERFELAIALLAFALLDVAARDANVSRIDASRRLVEPVFGA